VTHPLDVLLEVQAHDTRLDQLHHQLVALPAREERDAAAAAVREVEALIEADQEERDGHARDQKRLEDEIATVAAKRDHVNTTLYGGTVTNARELQDLSDELDALKRRITQLEDQEIEVMEKLEPVEARLAEEEATAAQRRTVLADSELRLTAAEAELRAALEAEEAAREATAAPVDPAMLAEYNSLRKGLGGTGVARLIGSQCGGCHLTLSAVEANRLRRLPENEIAHCEECGRLLVP
jgi:predicted  nucleic acid-binding Zn-ribbon protein